MACECVNELTCNALMHHRVLHLAQLQETISHDYVICVIILSRFVIRVCFVETGTVLSKRRSIISLQRSYCCWLA